MLTCIYNIESMRRELKTCFTILKSGVDAETCETKYADSFQNTKDIASAYIRETNQLIQKRNAHTQTINTPKATFAMDEMNRHVLQLKEWRSQISLSRYWQTF